MALWRAKQICEFFSISPDTFYRWVREDKRFPRERARDVRYVAWDSDDIKAYADLRFPKLTK